MISSWSMCANCPLFTTRKGGTLRFIITAKAAICTIDKVRSRVPQEVGVTAFTDEALDDRRKVELELTVARRSGRIRAELRSPVSTTVTLARSYGKYNSRTGVPVTGTVRYEFEVRGKELERLLAIAEPVVAQTSTSQSSVA